MKMPTACSGASHARRGASNRRHIVPMRIRTPVFPTMKTKNIFRLLAGAFLFVAWLPASTIAADLSQLIAAAAKWESGQNLEPLTQLEQRVRESAANAQTRLELESALTQLLVPTATFEARRFACQQLAVIGSDASVPAIARLLTEDGTIGIACLAFGNRPSAKADEALRTALTKSQGQGRLQIISALGNRRDLQAVESLTRLAREADVAVAQAAIRALGRIADGAACSAVVSLRAGASPALEEALADASLRCAEELAKSGDREGAAAICEPLIAPTQPEFVRRGAFAGLLRCDGDGGEQRILQTLGSSDDVLKAVAIAAVRELPSKGASAKLGKELPKLPAEQQVWLVESLAARSDAGARNAIAAALATSTDTGVRQAAAQALGRIGDARSVKPLVQALATVRDEAEANTIVAALAGLPAGRGTDKAMLSELKASQGKARAQLISSLAARRSPEISAALLKETENADPAVAKAAYRVLSKATTWATLPALLNKFIAIRDASRRSDAEAYLEQAVLNVENPKDRSDAVCFRLPVSVELETRLALLRLLPACGDDRSLRALKDAWGDPEAQVREVAVTALAEWPDAAAWEVLAYISRNPENSAQHSTALRGLTRLFGESLAAPETTQQVARAQELLDAARGDADLKLVLGALSGAKDAGVLRLVLPLLDNPAVRAEAEVAVKKIAEATKASDPEAAKAALGRLAK